AVRGSAPPRPSADPLRDPGRGGHRRVMARNASGIGEGKWETAYKRYRLWCAEGRWPRIMEALNPCTGADHCLRGPSHRRVQEAEPPSFGLDHPAPDGAARASPLASRSPTKPPQPPRASSSTPPLLPTRPTPPTTRT